MKNFLGNSSVPNYVKLTAVVLLGSTYLAALGVAGGYYVTYGPNAQLPSTVSFVIGTGLGLALNILGLHQGVQISEGNPAQTIVNQSASQVKESVPSASTPTP